jgi:manganese transport protein
VRDRPAWPAIAHSIVHPVLGGTESVLLAAGILGATVMPHVIFLHSSLTQNRIITKTPEQAQRLFRFEVFDVAVAMTLAGLVNAAMLVMAASTFWAHGLTKIATIEEAHRTLVPLLGRASGVVFAISLLASGLSSSTVGTMAGQVVMQGFLRRRVSIWIRRVVTMVPAVAVIAIGLDPTRTLVISQVILSFGLPFALIPLVLFTQRRDLMGALTNARITTAVAALVTGLIVALNIFLIYQAVTGR